MENKIPKTIHYCWFGRWKKSEKIMKCIESWKKYCPDYEIIEWNEDNFDVNINNYAKKYYHKKDWAFVADYARMNVLFNHWWIYFDTDVEVIKNIDNLLFNEAFTWFQDKFSIWWAILWSKKWNKIIKEILDYYETKKIKTILPNLLNRIFKRHTNLKYCENTQVIEWFSIYPKEYFYPYAYYERAQDMEITNNTYTIHHYDATWLPKIVIIVLFPIIGYISKYL